MTTNTQSERSIDTGIGFGFAEIAYLLRMFDTPASKKSAAVLRLEEEAATEPICIAGCSSLLGREFATVTDDIELTGPAMTLAYALARATRWTEISLVSADQTDTVVHVESDNVSLLLQPRTLNTWLIFGQNPDVTGPEAELAVIEEHVRSNPGGTAFLRVRTLLQEDHLLIRTDGTGWAVGRVPDPTKDVAETVGLDRVGLLDKISDTRATAGS